RYSFVHKSFLEYFVARTLWQALASNDHNTWNQRLLPETREIVQFLAEYWKGHSTPVLQDRLWGWIEDSKGSSQPSIAAANAATLLNACRVSFGTKDLTGVQLAGADLSCAMLDHTCLHGANLQGVNLSGAFLRATDFTQADLRDVALGEFPSVTFEDSVCAFAYNFDGQWLAVGVGSKLELWQADGSERVATLEEHRETLTCVAFSLDGKHLVSGSYDKTLRLWSVESASCMATLEGHTDTVRSVAFSPDGKYLVSGSSDYTLRLWSVESLSCL